MKNYLLIGLLMLSVHSTVFAQTRNIESLDLCPDHAMYYEPLFKGQKLIGLNSSIKRKTYLTGKVGMIVEESDFTDSPGIGSKSDNHLFTDSLLLLLFNNGLISGEDFIASHNSKVKEIYMINSDSVAFVKICGMEYVGIPEEYNKENQIICIRIWAPLRFDANCFGNFTFELFLWSKIKYNKNNLTEFLKNTDKLFLQFAGSEF